MNHQTIEFMARERIADMRREADQPGHHLELAGERAPRRLVGRLVAHLQASHPLGRWSTHRTSS